MSTLETTPAVKLRGQVVTEVVRAIIALTFVLYAACIVLIVLHRDVPGELWLGAGNASGALFALLINSKNEAGPTPVTVENAPDNPVPTDPQPPVEEPLPDAGPPVEDDVPEEVPYEEPPAPRRRSR